MSANPGGPAFSHMGFQVCDVVRMADFYKRVMGFTVTGRGELDTPHGRLYLVFLSRDPEEHHQIVLASGRPSDIPYNIVNQISFRVPDLTWLRSLHQSLRQPWPARKRRAGRERRNHLPRCRLRNRRTPHMRVDR